MLPTDNSSSAGGRRKSQPIPNRSSTPSTQLTPSAASTGEPQSSSPQNADSTPKLDLPEELSETALLRGFSHLGESAVGHACVFRRLALPVA
jgi:heme-binding NEAT domain protein